MVSEVRSKERPEVHAGRGGQKEAGDVGGERDQTRDDEESMHGRTVEAQERRGSGGSGAGDSVRAALGKEAERRMGNSQPELMTIALAILLEAVFFFLSFFFFLANTRWIQRLLEMLIYTCVPRKLHSEPHLITIVSHPRSVMIA